MVTKDVNDPGSDSPAPRGEPSAAALGDHDTLRDLKPAEPEFDPSKFQAFELPNHVRLKLLSESIKAARKLPKYRHRLFYALTGREHGSEAPPSSAEPHSPPPPLLSPPNDPRAGAARPHATDGPVVRRKPLRVPMAIAVTLIAGVLLGGIAFAIGQGLTRTETKARIEAIDRTASPHREAVRSRPTGPAPDTAGRVDARGAAPVPPIESTAAPVASAESRPPEFPRSARPRGLPTSTKPTPLLSSEPRIPSPAPPQRAPLAAPLSRPEE